MAKRTKKKAVNTAAARVSGKKKGPKKPPANARQFPTPKMQALATHAIKSSKASFRKAASQSGKFNQELDKELKKGIPGVKDMDADERAFCEGWLDLARLEHGEDYFDEKLVLSIRERINYGKMHVLNG